MGEPRANATVTVGQALKALREGQDLTLADIASRLRLDPRVIASIESGDHASLPGALYVRGYVRGYARLLGADADRFVDLYNESHPEEPPEILPEMSRPPQRTSEDTPVRLASMAVFIVLAVLLIAWWQTTYQGAGPSVAGPGDRAVDNAATAESTPARPVSQLPYSYEIVQHPTATFYRAPDATEEPIPAQDGEVATAVPMGASDGPAPTATQPPGPDSIRLASSTDSWVEITDRSGEHIYMDFVRSGESLTLTGHAPFSVVLGYAPDMTVEFNGQRVDTAPYTRAGVARFSLGQ